MLYFYQIKLIIIQEFEVRKNIMFNFKLLNVQACFSKLADQLLQADKWMLMNNNHRSILVKEIKTNKIYQLVTKQTYTNCWNYRQNCNIDVQESMEDVCVDNYSIFLQKIRLTHDYYLTEKSVMTLSDRIMPNKWNSSSSPFTQREILQTFMPILKSIAQKQIPNTYQISSNFIHIDSNQNIRLTDYNTAILNRNIKFLDRQFTLHEQMAIVILQSILLKPVDEIIQIMKQEQKIVQSLIQKQCSYQIIGLIFILLNQNKNYLPVTLYDFIKQGFSLSWFENLKINLSKKYSSFNENKSPHRKKTKAKKTAQSEEEQDQTQTSHQLAVSKYRSGVRVPKSGLDNENYEQLNDDIYYSHHLRTRRKKPRNVN